MVKGSIVGSVETSAANIYILPVVVASSSCFSWVKENVGPGSRQTSDLLLPLKIMIFSPSCSVLTGHNERATNIKHTVDVDICGPRVKMYLISLEAEEHNARMRGLFSVLLLVCLFARPHHYLEIEGRSPEAQRRDGPHRSLEQLAICCSAACFSTE